MTVKELNRSQIIELKERYLCQVKESVSYGELSNADNIVSDEEIFKEYDGCCFTTDDFSVSKDCILEFEIRCFERDLIIKLHNDKDYARAEKLMEMAYDKWLDNPEEVGDSCCEEYICKFLKVNGIKFTWLDKEE